MPKVYLSPAYHYWNPCAVAGCDETTHNNLYLDVLEPYLAACGIQYKRGPRRTPKSGEDGDALMLQAVRESDYLPEAFLDHILHDRVHADLSPFSGRNAVVFSN